MIMMIVGVYIIGFEAASRDNEILRKSRDMLVTCKVKT